MLKSIYIESLFGLYTYQLDIMPDGSEPIRFITGPNGYGKTTILRILHSIYTCNITSIHIWFKRNKIKTNSTFCKRITKFGNSTQYISM